MITRKQLVQTTESAIDNLIATFKTTPYLFYTENDLHCYLYTQILNSLPLKKWICETADGKESMLLHKEYPTKERYIRKALKEGLEKGSRGHFDLTIWNPEKTRERLFRVRQSTDFDREQHTFIAVEFDLIERNDNLDQAVHHYKWDLLKLRSAKNEIEHGYSLVFVRDWIYRDEFLKKIKGEVAYEKGIVILYVDRYADQTRVGTLSRKSFLNYERLF